MMQGRGMHELADMDALTLRDRLASGAFTATAVATAMLQRIAERDPAIGAWTTGPGRGDGTGRDAGRLSTKRAAARPAAWGPCRHQGHHRYPICRPKMAMPWIPGRRPSDDAVLVARLRAAGALILGKTVSTECAYLAPAKTRNPHDPQRTGWLVLGLRGGGRQRHGPTGDRNPDRRLGDPPGIVLRRGWFQTDLRPDSAQRRAADLPPTRHGRDFRPYAGRRRIARRCVGGPRSGRPGHGSGRRAASARSRAVGPAGDAAAGVHPYTGLVLDRGRLRGRLFRADRRPGRGLRRVRAAGIFSEGAIAHRRIMLAEMAHNLRHYAARVRTDWPPRRARRSKKGAAVNAADYLAALDWRETLYAGLEEVFERYDAIITRRRRARHRSAWTAPAVLHSMFCGH